MFEQRIKIILILFGLASLAVVARLFDLQVLRAETYRQQAEEALLRPPKLLPFIRGRILERSGAELAADQPCWEIAVDYGVLAMDPAYLRTRARQLRRTAADLTAAQAEEEVQRRITRMWNDVARFTGERTTDVRARAAEVCAKIDRVRAAVTLRRGFESPIAEERMRHAVVTGLNDQQQVDARQALHDYPWIEVRSSTFRHYHPSEALPHILGQEATVTDANLDADPDKDDPLARYLVSESLGETGVERAAESRLRGRRGLVRENRDGETVENIPPVDGEDVTLTLRLDLQEALYRRLDEMIPQTPHPAGGTVVVLDVPTREVLALVSYPGYDNNRFRLDYDHLALDTRRQPLRFRAVANQYSPGSIIKPLTCIAGLTTNKITLDTVFDCTGSLFPDDPEHWRCWPDHSSGQRMAHGPLKVSDALAHSCNIFMYQTGERVGVETLCSFFDMAGIGRLTGLGLMEEVPGINPTPAWLAQHERTVTPGLARLFAIGQAEVALTPIQAANLMAVYASGVYKPVTLIRPPASAAPAEWRLPVRPEYWNAIRSGLFRVANEPGATATKYAHFVRDGYALCGKTGSATVGRWPVAFTVPYTTAEGARLVAVVPAGSEKEAADRILAANAGAAVEREQVEVREYWPPLPPGRGKPAKPDQEHAWFTGYLQAVDLAGQPMLDVTPRVAFAVLVEFGGSGGRAAGPIAARAAETILDVLGPGLDPDATPDEARP